MNSFTQCAISKGRKSAYIYFCSAMRPQVDESTDDEKPSLKKDKKIEVKTSPKKKTGYVYFCSYNKDGVKSQNPEMTGKDITRELARLWKELTKDEQKEWTDSVAE